MDRRQFLAKSGAVAGVCGAWTGRLTATDQSSGTARWRTFRVTTEVEVLKPAGGTRVWIPLALDRDTTFQKPVSTSFQCGTGRAHRVRGSGGDGMVVAEFGSGVRPEISVVTEVRTRDWTADFAARRPATHTRAAELNAYLAPTKTMPTDGIVRERALVITKTARTDLSKARAIYDWIVENTYRNPKIKGCGRGDIRFMLESGDLGGKCADLNALYVGLARAAGLPARDIYGVRLGPSTIGCKSLGVATDDVTRAQHCRAEVFLADYGWIPVDPADVRKVMLEEPPGPRTLDDEFVKQARARLFGSWEMNWMAYNYGHDVVLPGSAGPALPYFMYPQAETDGVRLDALDPANFRYQIRSVSLS